MRPDNPALGTCNKWGQTPMCIHVAVQTEKRVVLNNYKFKRSLDEWYEKED